MTTHTDGKLFDYTDEKGVLWIMAACGHRCGGGVACGELIALCPNCRLLMSLGGKVEIVYPERLPLSLRQQVQP